jgi:hypothetical protein
MVRRINLTELQLNYSVEMRNASLVHDAREYCWSCQGTTLIMQKNDYSNNNVLFEDEQEALMFALKFS